MQIGEDKWSPEKKGAGSHNSSASSSIHYTWAEEILRAENGGTKTAGTNSDESLNSTSQSSTSKSQLKNRELSLEFLDNKNEEKFERLVKEDKIKTPFKRRHSNSHSSSAESRSNTPNSNSEMETPVDEAAPKTKGRHNRFNSRKVEKRLRHSSFNSNSSTSSSHLETDTAVIARRQKQIDYGKNTLAYTRYVQMVPKKTRTNDHPKTPDKNCKYSRRAFDGLIKIWRKELHYYDPPVEARKDGAPDSDSSDSD